MVFTRVTILVAALVLAACQASPSATPSRLPPSQPIAAGPDASSVKLTRIIVNLNDGDHIGELRGGAGCIRSVPYRWAGKLSILNDDDLVRAFNAEFKNANYPTIGDPDALFKEAEDVPEFLMAGRITKLALNYCLANADELTGDNAVTIEWQLFDVLNRRTVYKVTTFGRSEIDTPASSGQRRLFYDAFADAIRAFLADPKFHAIAGNRREIEPVSRVESVFRLYPRPAFPGPVTQNMAEVQAAAVTVRVPGGHGSGFFISSEGYLLTNAHVVGDAKFVRVRLASGREIAGEAIVVNRLRDVALIKVAEGGFTAFPIATTEPAIGADIYAVGAPYSPNLSTTVTRGIVSAYRFMNGVRMIQGDVTIQSGNSGGPMIDAHGNVAGISTSGIGENSTGINFFIPIDEALKAAGIERAETRTASPMRVLERPVAIALQPGRPKPPPAPAAQSPAAESPADPTAADPAPAAPQQVASLAQVAVPAIRDGTYRTRFRASTINGRSNVDLTVTIEGETIRGVGRTRGGLQCRATGEIAPDGTAWINVACSNSGSSYLSWQLAGRFVVEKDGAAYIGRLVYANLTGAPGEAVFRQ